MGERIAPIRLSIGDLDEALDQSCRFPNITTRRFPSIASFAAVFVFLLSATPALAHPGRTDPAWKRGTEKRATTPRLHIDDGRQTGDTLDSSGSTWVVRQGGGHPGPWDETIGEGRNTTEHAPDILTVDQDAAVSVTNKNAISVNDNVTLFILGQVTGDSGGSNGLFGTGPNVIEGNSNMTIVVGSSTITTALVEQLGTTSNGEAINLHGFANQIVNYGNIVSRHNSAAIWFQDVVSSGGDPNLRNIVTNYGTIEQSQKKNVIGTSAGNGIIFHNKSGGKVIGNLSFAGGDDDLYFEAGSSVDGNISGGGGTNALYLEGDTAKGIGILNGHIQGFQTLTKVDDGTWIMSGKLDGFETTTVEDGVLRITGDNSGYTGTLLIKPDGTVEARAQSLPSTTPAAGNVTNNGTLRFIQGLPGDPNDTEDPNFPTNPDDIGTYAGQIVGSGAVEMAGPGTVILNPSNSAGNTYTGGTHIKQGTIGIYDDNALGAVSGALTMGNGADVGTLRIEQDVTLDPGRAIQLIGGGGAFDTNGYELTITQTIAQPSGILYKRGEGDLVLTGENSLVAEAIVEKGTLQVGAGETEGSLAANPDIEVKEGAALAYSRSDDIAVTQQITGGGRVIQRGGNDDSATLEVKTSTFGPNSYTGGTEIESGRILITDADAYNRTNNLGDNAGTNAGHFLYAETGKDGTRTIEVDPAIGELQNHFHVEAGDKNIFKTTGDLTIADVVNGSDERLQGGAFYVGDGTLTMELGGDLVLEDNQAGTAPNDIYVDAAGALNIDVKDAGDTASVNSGMAGSGALALIGDGTVALNANSGMGATDVRKGTLLLSGIQYDNETDFGVGQDGVLAGEGTVASMNTKVYGHLDPSKVGSDYGTLTLASTGSAAMTDFTMDFDITTPTTVDWTLPQTPDQDLLVLQGPKVQDFNGTINFRTHAGFEHGTYLVITSENGFNLLGGNPLDGINNSNGVLKATLDGYAIHSNDETARQTVGFSYGQNGLDPNTIWLNNSLNSLTMDWDSTIDWAVWNSDELMSSLQTWTAGGVRETHFLSGDKVHISNPLEDPVGIITITLESKEIRNLIVSGLVVGKGSGTTGNNGGTGNGYVAITGAGGITADTNSAFGAYLPGGSGTPTLTPTGKLEKYGTGTLTFANTGGNMFKGDATDPILSGIDLYTGAVEFNLANQLGVADDAAIRFRGDGVTPTEATLRPTATVALDTAMRIDGGKTAIFDTPDGVYLLLGGEVDGTGIVNGNGNVRKTGGGTVQFAENVGATAAIRDTGVVAGEFRVVEGVEYGSSGVFTQSKDTRLTGGGTITAGSFDISGAISPDTWTMTEDETEIPTANRIATLTLQGESSGAQTVTFNSTVNGDNREGFNFDYRVTAPNTSSDPSATGNDLLALRNMQSVSLQGGVINFMTDNGSLMNGRYLIIDSNVTIDNTSGKQLNGIDGEGAMWGKVNGKDIRAGGPRGSFTFLLENGNATASQLWLTVARHSLQTVWQGGDGKWSTGGWKSVQTTNPDGTDLYDYNFYDGDQAYFTDEFGTGYTIEVDRDVIASGVAVGWDPESLTANNVDVTFDGAGGILARKKITAAPPDDDKVITGDYADGAPLQNQRYDTTGKLEKYGTGTLTLANTGDNTFEEGIDIHGGVIALVGSDRLGAYGSVSGHDAAGQVTFKYDAPGAGTSDGTDKEVQLGTAGTVENRFVVEEGVTNARIVADDDDVEIAGVEYANAGGGAIHIDDAASAATGAILTVSATNDASVTFRDNTANGVPNDAFVGDYGTLRIAAGGSADGDTSAVFFQSGVAGDATAHLVKTGVDVGGTPQGENGLVQIEALSEFAGTTTVEGGIFRVVGDRKTLGSEITYGVAASSVFKAESDNVVATVAGGGVIEAKTVTLGDAVISPDSDTVTKDAKKVADGKKFGTLTFRGDDVDSTSSLDGFTMNYDVDKANVEGDWAALPYVAANTTNDLLAFDGMETVAIESGTINFVGPLASGKYLVIDSNVNFTVGGNGEIDGLVHEGVLQAQRDGGAIEEDTPRGYHEFVLRDGVTPGSQQVWFVVDRNTLTMKRVAGGDWFGDTGWDSAQYVPLGGAGALKYAKSFEDGDYAKLSSASGADYELDIGRTALVSGMDVDSAGVITLTGVGGITSTVTDPSIEGIYIETNLGNNPDNFTNDRGITPDGKLIKTGDGSLVFRNTGLNNFEKGIDLSDGTIAFNLASQLGNRQEFIPGGDGKTIGKGNDVRVLDDATLRADKSATTYNNVDVAADTTADFEVVDGEEWRYSGDLTNGGATSIVNKTGAGTLSLYNHLEEDPLGSGTYVPTASSYTGFFQVSAGKMAVYGDYGLSGGFAVGRGAILSGTGFLGSKSGDGHIESGGTLAPDGLSRYAAPADGDDVAAPVENPLTIVGDLTFDPGSNFDVRITQFGVGADGKYVPYSDRVNVTDGGTVTIDPKSVLNVAIDFWGGSQTINDYSAEKSGYFTIIDAEVDNMTPGVVADYDAQFTLHLLTTLPRGVKMMQGWGGDLLNLNEFQLWFADDPDNGFDNLCDRHNRVEIGVTLDQLVWSRDPGLQDLINLLSDPEFSNPDVCGFLDRLTGDIVANALAMALKKPWRQPFARLDGLRPGCRVTAEDLRDEDNTPAGRYMRQVWAQYYGRTTDTRSDKNANTYDLDRNGLILGFDYAVGPNAVLGLAFNYSDPRLKQSTGSVRGRDYEFGLYGLARLPADFELKGYAGYSHQRYDIKRNVFIPGTSTQAAINERFKNKTHGHAFAASLELTRPFCLDSNWMVTPIAALDYERARIDGYREHGGITALSYSDSRLTSFVARAGVDAQVSLGDRLDLRARVQYARELTNRDYGRTNVRFAQATTPQRNAHIRGVAIGKDYLNAGVGADVKLNDSGTMKAFARYDADVYRRQTTHTGEVGLSLVW